MSARRADLVIIGAGVLGAFHAYFASKRGLSVLLLERNALPADASTRNFGMTPRTIVPPDGEWAGYARDTAEIYAEIQRKRDISVRTAGSLYLASTEKESSVLHEFVQEYSSSFRCKLFGKRKARERFPFIHGKYCSAALLFPDDLGLDPRAMLIRLIPFLVETERIEYVPNTTVVSAVVEGEQCIATSAFGEKFAGDQIIFCGGAEYRTLFPTVFRSSGLRVCKLQMMRTVPNPPVLPHSVLSGLSIGRYPAFSDCPSYPALLEEADDVLSAYGIHLLLRQTPDGSVIIGDSHEYSAVFDADLGIERTNPAINDAILSYARGMVRLPSWDIEELWNGYYLMHPEKPVFATSIEGAIHVITGIAGKGMSTGPGFARASIDRLFT